MSITIELTNQELALIKELTRLSNDSEAVVKAAREFLRVCKLRELKAASGTVEFKDVSKELDAAELNGSRFPIDNA